jgi:hypothetical protein
MVVQPKMSPILKMLFLIILGILLSVTDGKAGFYEKSYALVIGIDEYPSPAWPHLDYAKNDAMAVAAFLKKQGFDDVTTLYNRQATKTEIISKLQNDLAPRVNQNDRILFFFAGHGYTEELGGKDWGYIVPYHTQRVTSASYISMEELRTLSEKMGTAKHHLFIMDSCYGGLIGTRGSGLDINLPYYLEKVTERHARQIITAGGKNQTVLDKGPGGHSVFTGNLLEAIEEGLADANSDGYITFAELTAYLVPRASNAFQTPTSAILPSHGQGEFVFVSPKGGKIAPPTAGGDYGGGTRGDEEVDESDSASVFGNSFSNLRVVDSPKMLKIKIKYTFYSKHGEIAKAAARPLKAGRYPNQFFSHSTEIIEKGRGELSFAVTFFPKGSTSTISTDQLEFVMWNQQHGTFFRVPFTLKKTWQSD